MTDSNSAKGRTSRDAKIGSDLVSFINRSVTPYPTEVGGPKFDLVPVESQKDLMVNAARLHARQEYARIMELVEVLQRQAADLERRLDLTDQVRNAKYDFQLYHGQFYWLLYDQRKQCTRLSHTGPANWATGKPVEYEYITRIQWLGDYTFKEVDPNNPE
jgi:hypothetical protein